MTDYQKIAVVKYITGKTIKLGMMESVSDFLLFEDKILISVNRARVVEKKNELMVTQRGYTMWTFYKQRNEATGRTEWRYPEPVTYWHEDFTPEVHKTYVTCAEEHIDQRAWEALCYRPGTPDSPMDGPNARLT